MAETRSTVRENLAEVETLTAGVAHLDAASASLDRAVELLGGRVDDDMVNLLALERRRIQGVRVRIAERRRRAARRIESLIEEVVRG